MTGADVVPAERWRTAVRTVGELLVAAVCALLLFVVFPWVEPHLPVNDVTVDG